jgi:hypothetical protein
VCACACSRIDLQPPFGEDLTSVWKAAALVKSKAEEPKALGSNLLARARLLRLAGPFSKGPAIGLLLRDQRENKKESGLHRPKHVRVGFASLGPEGKSPKSRQGLPPSQSTHPPLSLHQSNQSPKSSRHRLQPNPWGRRACPTVLHAGDLAALHLRDLPVPHTTGPSAAKT